MFLPGDQLVSTVEGTVGSTGGGSSSANASTTVDPPAPEFVEPPGERLVDDRANHEPVVGHDDPDDEHADDDTHDHDDDHDGTTTTHDHDRPHDWHDDDGSDDDEWP